METKNYEKNGYESNEKPYHFVPSQFQANAYMHENEEPQCDPETFESCAQPFMDIPPRLTNMCNSVVLDVNDWHMPMVNDLQRNDAYRDALRKLVKPNDVVLEIGCGSGILSMLAARCNPKKVYAIEASTDFATIANENLKKNGLSEKVQIIPEMSTNVYIKKKKRKLQCSVEEITGNYSDNNSPIKKKRVYSSTFSDDADKRIAGNEKQIKFDGYAPEKLTKEEEKRRRLKEKKKRRRKRKKKNKQRRKQEEEEHSDCSGSMTSSPKGSSPISSNSPVFKELPQQRAREEEIRRKKTRDQIDKRALPEPCTLLVSEIVGTLLDGESQIHYYADARKRLLAPNAKIVPNFGIQYASLFSSKDFQRISQAFDYDGLNLSCLNKLRDPCSLLLSKNYGIIVNQLDFKELCRYTLYEVDLEKDDLAPFNYNELTLTETCMDSGEAVGLIYWWELFLDKERTIKVSTHPLETIGNIPRDLNWGQGLQLIEDPKTWNKGLPTLPVCTKGKPATVQFRCQKGSASFYQGKVMAVG